jgi:dTMP kinase
MNKETLLISIEGIDGSGKSTLIKKLSEVIPNSLATQSPRGTELGQKVWDLVTENLISRKLITDVWTEFFLFTANHNEHALTVIKPNLATGKTVLIDRYIDSTLVYQGIRGKLPIAKLVKIWQNTIDIPYPDLTFVLDIEPTKTAERVNKRQQETGEEPNNWDNSKLDFHQTIRNGYLKMQSYFPERIYIINADRNQEEVFKEVWEIIEITSSQKAKLNEHREVEGLTKN